MGQLVPEDLTAAKRLAYRGIWWVLSSRLRFLDECTVGDSWATDGMASEESLMTARMARMSRDVDRDG